MVVCILTAAPSVDTLVAVILHHLILLMVVEEHNCETSTEEATKTVSTSCTKSEATENYAKQENQCMKFLSKFLIRL